MADQKAAKTQLTDLNSDIFTHLSTFLDFASLYILTTTSTRIRAKLTDQMMWRTKLVNHWNDIGEEKETVSSLIGSDFRDVIIKSREALTLCGFLETLETVVILVDTEELSSDHHLLDDLTWGDSVLPSGSLGSVRCFIVNVFDFGISPLIRYLPLKMPSLRGLYINQSASDQSADGIIDILTFLPLESGVEELQQISFNRNGLCYNACQNGMDDDRVFGTVKKLFGVQMNRAHELARSFPQLEHLTLRKLYNSEQLKQHTYCRIPTLRSLRVYHEEYNRDPHVFARLRKLITVCPNIRALDLSNVVTKRYPNSLSISENTIGKLIDTCPSLVILNISNAYEVTLASTELIIRRLGHLKYLILPTGHRMVRDLNSAAAIEMIAQYGLNMVSLLGVPKTDHISDKVPKLEYVYDSFRSEGIVKLQSSQSEGENAPTFGYAASPAEPIWDTAEKFSEEWYSAHGAEYFNLDSSIDHLQMVDPEVVIPDLAETQETMDMKASELRAHSRYRFYDRYEYTNYDDYL